MASKNILLSRRRRALKNTQTTSRTASWRNCCRPRHLERLLKNEITKFICITKPYVDKRMGTRDRHQGLELLRPSRVCWNRTLTKYPCEGPKWTTLISRSQQVGHAFAVHLNATTENEIELTRISSHSGSQRPYGRSEEGETGSFAEVTGRRRHNSFWK